MDIEDSYKTNLNIIKEMILDEEKLVTYITLSKDLCVHVNDTKQLLCNAIQLIREEQPNVSLSVNYVISGTTANNTAITTICAEKDLDRTRKSLNIVFFHHVYSLCKGSSGIDNAALLLLSKYGDYSLCPGLIKNKDCIKRTSEEIGYLKSCSQEIVLEDKQLVVNKKLKQEPKEVLATHSEANETNGKDTEIKIKTETISPKKPIIKQNIHKTQKNIAIFFNKSNISQNNKKCNDLPTKKDTNGVQHKTVTEMPIDSKIKEEIMDFANEDSKKINIKTEAITKNPKNGSKNQEKIAVENEPLTNDKNKILNKIKKTSRVDKKRKRVFQVSDSEEDNDPFADNQETKSIENNESDDEIPPTPSADSIKITSGLVNPKKRRKVIDKTYTDEDGYTLTKKEEIYVSCSDNENEIKTENNIKVEKEIKKIQSEISPNKTTKSSPKKSKKKISPPQKGRQPTLNSFFSKK